MTTLLLIIATAFAPEQETTFIDFEEVELTDELTNPRFILIVETPRPEPDLLILDLRQFILDKEAADNNSVTPQNK